MVSEVIDCMKISFVDVMVVLVGGGSIIIFEELIGVKVLICNKNGVVVNVIGVFIV